MTYVRCVWFSAVVTLMPAAAHAQPQTQPVKPAAPLSDKVKAQTAKQYVDAGLAAQSTGDYVTAITFYTKAYELVPHPVLIFNIAQATRLAGHLDEALNLYAKYLTDDPSGAQAQTARDIVAEINAHRADEARKADEARQPAASRQPPSPPAEPAPASQPPSRAPSPVASAAPPPPPPPASLVATSAPADAPAPGRGLRLAGIATGAVGVVGVGLGIGFALHGRSIEQQIETQYNPATRDAGNRANAIAYAGTIGGGALIVAGVAMYLLGHRDAERFAIAPTLSSQSVGLAVSGRLP